MKKNKIEGTMKILLRPKKKKRIKMKKKIEKKIFNYPGFRCARWSKAPLEFNGIIDIILVILRLALPRIF